MMLGGLLAGCPSNPIVPIGTDSDSTGPGDSCTPGEVRDCTCPGGAMGTQACVGDGFDPCQCETLDTGTLDGGTTTGDTTTGDTTTSDTSTTGPQPCTTNEECADAATHDCEEGICGEDGSCTTQPIAFGTPCGSATADECTAPDTCNNSGECLANDVDEGLACSTCPSGECTCTAGACGECNAFAPTNNFITSRSIEGWELTGGWGLYRQTPSSEVDPPSLFFGQVLGTDGNRAPPYPGSEIESSYARTRPFPLPPVIAFLSWNVDEGANDNKTVRVSVDGGTSWDTLVDCTIDASWPMCQPSLDQDPAVFDLVQIPVPPAMQGVAGIVEFGYDSGDACCDFEKGWYIDSLNLATECRCQENSDCADVSGVCGTGLCVASGECALQPMPADTACGDPLANDCNGADLCDGVGYCRDNLEATGLALCGDCPSGGPCSFCDAGQCLDCLTFSEFGDFNDPGSISEWTTNVVSGTLGWGLYDAAPPNATSGAVAFPNAPVFGTDGNRSLPYPGGELENGNVITGEGLVPPLLTFISWHVDEGGGFYDQKRIELTVNGGVSWTTLVDCVSLPGVQPFCLFEDDGRLGTDWDPISINIAAIAPAAVGMTGQLRFTYNSSDSCCDFERGWFIDDLNAFSISCNDVAFP